MIDVPKLSDEQLVRLINNRWTGAGTSLWSKIEKYYAENKKIWQNQPDYLEEIPKKRSKARDNRIFLAMESVISNLTGRPSKPNAIPGNETEEAATIAGNLQDYLLERYRQIAMKKKMRKGLRYLFFSRLIVMKVFWDPNMDNFDQKPVHPLKIRFTPTNATSREEVDVWMEEIDITLDKMIERFPDQEARILELAGYSNKEELYVNSPEDKYYEVWLGDWVVYRFRNIILKRELNPYWDWEGVKVTKDEVDQLKATTGKRRRAMAAKIKGFQRFREKASKEKAFEYETAQYNHFEKPMPPYMFGTIFEEEDKPIGETSLIEQAAPLQIEIDKRKRQFCDNAEMMNGVWKIDTSICELSKADAQRAKADPRGIIWGKGVRDGVTRETGTALPEFLYQDLVHSTVELDNIFGTQPTFRGEKGTQETATGRAILREQSFQRLNEFVDLVDSLHEQSYNWWLQMMKLRFTQKRLANVIGKEKATETIDLMQDDFDDGIEIRVVPGQIMPEDKLFKSEKATEAVTAGLLDPLSYFEITEWVDDPVKQYKRLIMYQMNPLSLVELDEDDKRKIQEAAQLFGQGQGGGQGGQGGDERARQVASVREEAERLINSPEFKKMSPAEQKNAQQQIKQRLQNITQAK